MLANPSSPWTQSSTIGSGLLRQHCTLLVLISDLSTQKYKTPWFTQENGVQSLGLLCSIAAYQIPTMIKLGGENQPIVLFANKSTFAFSGVNENIIISLQSTKIQSLNDNEETIPKLKLSKKCGHLNDPPLLSVWA